MKMNSLNNNDHHTDSESSFDDSGYWIELQEKADAAAESASAA